MALQQQRSSFDVECGAVCDSEEGVYVLQLCFTAALGTAGAWNHRLENFWGWQEAVFNSAEM